MKQAGYILLGLCGVFLVGCFHGHRSKHSGEDPFPDTKRLPRSRSENPSDWNVMVRMKKLEYNRRGSMMTGVNWSAKSGNVRVGGGGISLQNNGLQMGVTGKHFSATISGDRRVERNRQSQSMFITVRNGSSGMIMLRRQSPQLVSYFVYGGPGGRKVVKKYNLRSTGMYLQITPRIIGRGPEMDVSVVPVVARSGKNAVEIEELRTRLRVRSGEKVVIAGTDSKSNSIGDRLFSTRRSTQKRKTVWILSPEILK